MEKEKTGLEKTNLQKERLDLQKLGFKSGIEIHQRLATREKLFCRCPAAIQDEAPVSGTLLRKLRAVAGELGVVDPAAAFEAARHKTFTYQLIAENACLVEQDEEPPAGLNKQALNMALTVSKMLNAQALDEIHVMRKMVADGSATSAFQRTALVALNGRIQTSLGDVAIPTICIEEESSGIVSRESDSVIYRLDRLGIPLIEIATDASLQSGAHVAETAEKIGRLLRSAGFAQRGLGTIRQDINVSIAGGTRVEIKGAQQLEDLAALAENEALRQHHLLQIAAELKRRGVNNTQTDAQKNAQTGAEHRTQENPHGVGKVAFGKPHGVSHHFKKAKSFLSQPIAEGKAVAMAIKLLFCKGLLGREIMPNHRFGTELSDYAKSKTGIKGIIHCDEDPTKYGLTPEDFKLISKELDCIEDDGWAIVVADELNAVKALHAVFDRCYTLEIPKETRKAEGQVSHFMRPLPGAARMYPETDVLPVVVTGAHVDGLELPKTTEERIANYIAKGLAPDMADRLVKSSEWELFDQLTKGSGGTNSTNAADGTNAKNADAKTVAWLLLEVKPTLRRAGVDVNIPQERMAAVLRLFSQGYITRAAVPDVLTLVAKEPNEHDAQKLAKAANLLRIRGTDLEKLCREHQNSFPDIIKRYRLQVDAGELKGLLEKKT
ncbi:Glu-tRNA(Gln) amidotransferase subunit GatE [Candidatus Micrarchaeota archaeon]|nr:Glu-tRNA(Gln) amidotransferase subunit GatE [Candidatus Micrarchaeota archaeon]